MKRFLMEAEDGTLVSVPENKLSEYEKQQEELKADSEEQQEESKEDSEEQNKPKKRKLEPWQIEAMRRCYEFRQKVAKEAEKYL